MPQKSSGKLYYINNLRTLLIILIVMLHIAITYGAEGSWYYFEHTESIVSNVILTLFVAIVQAFVLGFFFMISGYFIPSSLKRKGAKRYLKDRLLRLGVPLIVYYFVISPILTYSLYVKLMGEKLVLRDYFGSGPLWFVELLLIFSIFYILIQFFSKPKKDSTNLHSFGPNNKNILIFALCLSMVNFFIRIWFPIGKTFFNHQFAFFPGYISFFIFGIIAFGNKWFDGFSLRVGKRWLKISVAVILLFPVISILGGALEDVSPFKGGFHYQSLLFSTWEAFVGIGLTAGLFVTFRKHFNYQGDLAKNLSDNVYTVYIIHAPVIVFFTYSIHNMFLYPLLKFIFVSIVGVSLCFLISHYLVRNIPYAKRIL